MLLGQERHTQGDEVFHNLGIVGQDPWGLSGPDHRAGHGPPAVGGSPEGRQGLAKVAEGGFACIISHAVQGLGCFLEHRVRGLAQLGGCLRNRRAPKQGQIGLGPFLRDGHGGPGEFFARQVGNGQLAGLAILQERGPGLQGD